MKKKVKPKRKRQPSLQFTAQMAEQLVIRNVVKKEIAELIEKGGKKFENKKEYNDYVKKRARELIGEKLKEGGLYDKY